jgi:hypothetical protein
MTADAEEAKLVLFEFLTAMKEWNDKFATLIKNGGLAAHGDQAEAELQPIYEKYVTMKNQGSPIFSIGYPSEYDSNAEKIVSIHSPNVRKVIIETLWTHPDLPTSTQQNRNPPPNVAFSSLFISPSVT